MENRNGSGYVDPTANDARVFGNYPMDGEIWQDNAGTEYLILRSHESEAMCNVLKLFPNQRPGCVKIISRMEMYANPAYTSYRFFRNLTEYVKGTTQEDYLDVMQAVGDALSVRIKVSAEKEAQGTQDEETEKKLEWLEKKNEDAWESIASLEKRRDDLKAEVEEAWGRLADVENRMQREQEIAEALRRQLDEATQEKMGLRAELVKCKERLRKCCEKLIDLGILED